MKIGTVILVAVLTFGVCFLVDKGYTRVFRSKEQYQSGLSVRVSKRYGAFGLVMLALAALALVNGWKKDAVLFWGGMIVLVIGAGLIVYYLGYGLFYDEDTFLVTGLGKKSRTYRYSDIREQRLYLITGGGTVIELTMADGKAVSIQSGMEGAYPFLDFAFSAWCRQTGRDPEQCSFHDPANSIWFPTGETGEEK